VSTRLFELLPRHIRTADEVHGGRALEALTAVMQEELDRLDADVERLADDWFVETCQEWVVPYIGDLLGVRGLAGSPREGGFSQRAFVANTVGYRRRKGTAAVLEQLARDVTGWPARAVEFFERMVASQHLNHVRLHAPATVSLRSAEALERLGGPFEEACHNADVRHVDNGRGRYDIPHVGIFLWRLQEYLLTRSTAFEAIAADPTKQGLLFTFSPLGNDAPLFAVPRGEEEIDRLAGEHDVPGRLRRRPLFDELKARRDAAATGETAGGPWFDPPPVLRVFAANAPDPRPVADLRVCDLSSWRLPAAGTVSVDPVLGRIAFPAGEAPAAGVEVTYAYGFPGDLGGGPYPRGIVVDPDTAGLTLMRVPSDDPTPAAALAGWTPRPHQPAVLVIEDSRTYAGDLAISLPEGASLTILAADQQRPVLVGSIQATGAADSALTLDGVLLAGTIMVDGDLEVLTIRDSTIVPGRGLTPDGEPAVPWAPSIAADPGCLALRVRLEKSITGPLRLPADGPGIEAADSIVHGGTPEPAWIAEARVTVPRVGEKPSAALARVAALVRAAANTPAYQDAVVRLAGNEIAVVSGIPASSLQPPNAGGDLSALRLGSKGAAIPRMARVGSALGRFRLSAAQPRLQVTISGAGPFPVALDLPPRTATLADAAAALQKAVRGAAPGPSPFTGAVVATDGRRLFVIAGEGGDTPRFLADPGDATTVAELGLDPGHPPGAADPPVALAGPFPGDPGPPATLERCTVFGSVRVRELVLGSSCIFTEPVVADRRQTGCVRHSFVPAGSAVPRPYRCQPELALREALSAEERRTGGAVPAEVRTRVQRAVEGRVRPDFVSVRYGTPAYAQLDATCAPEIFRGADDDNEMGAFNLLQAAWRLDRFRESLDEYLRFGLEAGVFFVT